MFQEFDFNFGDMPSGIPTVQKQPKVMECWVPLVENPQLSLAEQKSILYKEGYIDSLHLVRPGLLYLVPGGGVSYTIDVDLGYYMVAAKLKKSPLMLLLGDYQQSSQMTIYLEENNLKFEETYHLDTYFSPNFGIVRPRQFLFEKVQLQTLPNSPVLFKPPVANEEG